MTKKIKKYLVKRNLKRLLKQLKKHWVHILAALVPLVLLLIIHHQKKKAKKKLKQAVKAKVREDIDRRLHGDEEESTDNC